MPENKKKVTEKDVQKEVISLIGENHLIQPYRDYDDKLDANNITDILQADNSMDAFDELVDEISLWSADYIMGEFDALSYRVVEELKDKGFLVDDEAEELISEYVSDYVWIDWSDYLGDTFPVYVMISTPHEQNLDHTGVPNRDYFQVDYEAIDDEDITNMSESFIGYLAKEQGYNMKDIVDAIFGEDTKGLLETSKFVSSLYQEVLDGSYMAATTVLGTLTIEDAINLKDGKVSLTLTPQDAIGLFDPWHGSGGMFGIVLEKKVKVPSEYIEYIGAAEAGKGAWFYSPQDVYGFSKSIYKNYLEVSSKEGKKESKSLKNKPLKESKENKHDTKLFIVDQYSRDGESEIDLSQVNKTIKDSGFKNANFTEHANDEHYDIYIEYSTPSFFHNKEAQEIKKLIEDKYDIDVYTFEELDKSWGAAISDTVKHVSHNFEPVAVEVEVDVSNPSGFNVLIEDESLDFSQWVYVEYDGKYKDVNTEWLSDVAVYSYDNDYDIAIKADNWVWELSMSEATNELVNLGYIENAADGWRLLGWTNQEIAEYLIDNFRLVTGVTYKELFTQYDPDDIDQSVFDQDVVNKTVDAIKGWLERTFGFTASQIDDFLEAGFNEEIHAVVVWSGSGYWTNVVSIDEPTTSAEYALNQALAKLQKEDKLYWAGFMTDEEVEEMYIEELNLGYIDGNRIADLSDYADYYNYLYVDASMEDGPVGYIVGENLRFLTKDEVRVVDL